MNSSQFGKREIFHSQYHQYFSFKCTLQEKTGEGTEEEIYFFRVTEAIFVGWFTFEYIIRFIVAPHKVNIPGL